MTDAYKCDKCGEYSEGIPAAEFEIETGARVHGGDVVLADGTRVTWDRQSEWVEFCPDCAPALIETMNEAIKDD